MAAIHGAASAAVVAVSRLSGVLPVTPGPGDEALGAAGFRLASSLERLEGVVTGLVAAATASEPAEAIRPDASAGHEAEKWQKRYHAVERERDSLQEMLVGLKDKYEKLQRAYHDASQAHDRKILEYEALQLRSLDARHRLESSLFLLETLLRSDEEEEDE